MCFACSAAVRNQGLKMNNGIRQAVIGALAAGALALGSVPASASLIGDEMTYRYLFPDRVTEFESSTFVVDGTVEVLGLGGFFTIDVAESSASIFFESDAPFIGADFSGIEISGIEDDSGDGLSNVALTSSVTLPVVGELLPLLLEFDSGRPGAFRIDWSGMTFFAGDRVDLQFSFGDGPGVQDPAGSVPEPGSLALLAAGVAAAGLGRGRRERPRKV